MAKQEVEGDRPGESAEVNARSRSRSRSDAYANQGGNALCFSARTHLELRRHYERPIVGLPMGTLPSNPQQNSQLGAPFVYSLAQKRLLDAGSNQGKTVKQNQGGNDTATEASVDAQRSDAEEFFLDDLSRRGYCVLGGSRHGFDMVAYEGDPVRHHGSHFLKLCGSHDEISAKDLVLWNRLAAAANKTAIVGEVTSRGRSSEAPQYFQICGEER